MALHWQWSLGFKRLVVMSDCILRYTIPWREHDQSLDSGPWQGGFVDIVQINHPWVLRGRHTCSAPLHVRLVVPVLHKAMENDLGFQ